MRRIEPDHAHASMVASYQAVTDDVGKLDEDELARPSRWALFRPGTEGYDEHPRFVRRVASSYRSDLVIAAQQAETAAAAAHAAGLPADVTVATQGHVLFASDFLATLAVEATIHHLDLATGDGNPTGPSGPGLAVTRETLDGVLGQRVPADWDDVSYVLKATGRAELTDSDRASLGALAARFPLLG